MKKYSTWQKIAAVAAPFILAPLIYILGNYILSNFILPGCMTYQLFGVYCPGCGMTRSVAALLHGDVLLSLRQNAFVILGIIAVAVIYLRYLLKIFGVMVKPLRLSKTTVYTLIIIAGIYSVLRNFIPAIAPI